MALTSSASGALHPGAGARGFTFGPATTSNQAMYTCPAGKIAYIYAGVLLKVDGLTYPHFASGGITSATRTHPFYITAGQVISSSSSSDSYGMGIEIDA